MNRARAIRARTFVRLLGLRVRALTRAMISIQRANRIRYYVTGKSEQSD